MSALSTHPCSDGYSQPNAEALSHEFRGSSAKHTHSGLGPTSTLYLVLESNLHTHTHKHTYSYTEFYGTVNAK